MLIIAALIIGVSNVIAALIHIGYMEVAAENHAKHPNRNI